MGFSQSKAVPWCAGVVMLFASMSGVAGEGHEHGQEVEQEVVLSEVQIELAGIETEVLVARSMDIQVYAPGEIKANGYTSYLVSPRIDSVVLRLHVTLGEHVKKGQPLVTLFSESMVNAQAEFIKSMSQWRRLKQMGRKVVGDQDYEVAQTDYQAAFGRLKALGLAEQAIKALSIGEPRLGEYQLSAAIDGAVLSDDFHQGQQVTAGQALIELADEHQLWVDARLPANAEWVLVKGSRATVKVADDHVEASVSQQSHIIDRQTRTRVVRLLIDNHDDRFHAGMFADVYFSLKTQTPVMAVPESALVSNGDGDWQLFIEQSPGRFYAKTVKPGRALGKLREIKGIKAGETVVTKGAFFIHAQNAKSDFDTHNH